MLASYVQCVYMYAYKINYCYYEINNGTRNKFSSTELQQTVDGATHFIHNTKFINCFHFFSPSQTEVSAFEFSRGPNSRLISVRAEC